MKLFPNFNVYNIGNLRLILHATLNMCILTGVVMFRLAVFHYIPIGVMIVGLGFERSGTSQPDQ